MAETSPMTAFTGEERKTVIHKLPKVKFDMTRLEEIRDIKELPEAMRITDSDISKGVSWACFLCYGDSIGVPVEMLSGRSGFTCEEVKEVVADAKQRDLYEDLVKEFRR